eukprot:Lithocolla_globosa_v1_NODE_1216_length_2774_cov_8.362633.p3 type:complete len:105 gc:universal NODE_1216_length_2774_cov_8.362633:2481-2167(-)
MNLTHTSGGCSTYRATNITRSPFVVVDLTGGSHNTRVDVGISSHVFRLLLCPDNFSVAVGCDILGDAFEWEGCNLLEANKGNIGTAALFTLGEKFVVNLTAAEH